MASPIKAAPIQIIEIPTENNQPPVVKEFKELWDTWFADPSRDTATNLLGFTKDPDHKAEFEQLAKHALPPYHGATFDHDYDTACNQLQIWIDSGCRSSTKVAVSEFLHDLYCWINQS